MSKGWRNTLPRSRRAARATTQMIRRGRQRLFHRYNMLDMESWMRKRMIPFQLDGKLEKGASIQMAMMSRVQVDGTLTTIEAGINSRSVTFILLANSMRRENRSQQSWAMVIQEWPFSPKSVHHSRHHDIDQSQTEKREARTIIVIGCHTLP
jgi:hypothetical protein